MLLFANEIEAIKQTTHANALRQKNTPTRTDQQPPTPTILMVCKELKAINQHIHSSKSATNYTGLRTVMLAKSFFAFVPLARTVA